MHHNKRERQWHSQEYRSGLQPSPATANRSWDYVPCWHGNAPSALGIGVTQQFRPRAENLP
jgi:hypothetical protein